jgi:two-component system, OmpR family, response regulator RegX3
VGRPTQQPAKKHPGRPIAVHGWSVGAACEGGVKAGRWPRGRDLRPPTPGRSALLPTPSGGDDPDMSSERVLVVDDERKIREVVGSYLERQGYRVSLFEDGESALAAMTEQRPSLVVLDLVLPDIPGEEVARAVRAVSDVPIVMLTAKSSEDDRVAGLELGADDYLVKPFSVRELAARVAAVLRRARAAHPDLLSFDGGRLVLERVTRKVTVGGEPVELTHTESELLFALVDHAGQTLTRDQLITLARGFDAVPEERTVDAHVKNVRRKLGDDRRHPHTLVTEIGVGYRFGLRPDA